MTRRTLSKLLVILIVVPVAIRAWQIARGLGDSPAETKPVAAQVDEAAKTGLEGRAPDGTATGSDDE